MIKKKVRVKLLSSAKGCLYDNKRILDDWRRCEKLRTDQGFTMQKLSLGLCSAAIFSRIEAYEWDMDTRCHPGSLRIVYRICGVEPISGNLDGHAGGSDFRDLCLCVQSGDRIGASGYCSF